MIASSFFEQLGQIYYTDGVLYSRAWFFASFFVFSNVCLLCRLGVDIYIRKIWRFAIYKVSVLSLSQKKKHPKVPVSLGIFSLFRSRNLKEFSLITDFSYSAIIDFISTCTVLQILDSSSSCVCGHVFIEKRSIGGRRFSGMKPWMPWLHFNSFPRYCYVLVILAKLFFFRECPQYYVHCVADLLWISLSTHL